MAKGYCADIWKWKAIHQIVIRKTTMGLLCDGNIIYSLEERGMAFRHQLSFHVAPWCLTISQPTSLSCALSQIKLSLSTPATPVFSKIWPSPPSPELFTERMNNCLNIDENYSKSRTEKSPLVFIVGWSLVTFTRVSLE